MRYSKFMGSLNIYKVFYKTPKVTSEHVQRNAGLISHKRIVH